MIMMRMRKKAEKGHVCILCGSLAGFGWHVPDAAQLPPPRAVKYLLLATREEDAEEVDASYSS